MRIHFIAIGGAVMHNLALALQAKGYQVSGSDDEIFEPARSRLEAAGLLPARLGWDVERIEPGVDAVILGMHARADNPELARALELGLPVHSFPEFMYLQTRSKRRVVVAGSHGKTTVTALVMHALRQASLAFDFLVGAQLDGFQTMVGLEENSTIAVFEGDEYLSSAIDRRPKFLHYRPDIALINGIAWDHINVFPTFEQYRGLFRELVVTLCPGSTLALNREDPEVLALTSSVPSGVKVLEYGTPVYSVHEGRYCLLAGSREEVPVQLIGRHNMLNVEAARTLCSALGVADEVFYRALPGFRGASRRLNLVRQARNGSVYSDFAHAPSKVAATVAAVKEAFPDRRLFACLELHTFSSLNRAFLLQYRGSLDNAEHAIVYFDPHTIQLKRLPPLAAADVAEAFRHRDLTVVTTRDELERILTHRNWKATNLLLMSSGTFSGLDINALAAALPGMDSVGGEW